MSSKESKEKYQDVVVGVEEELLEVIEKIPGRFVDRLAHDRINQQGKKPKKVEMFHGGAKRRKPWQAYRSNKEEI